MCSLVILIIFLSYPCQWSSSQILILAVKNLWQSPDILLNVCCVQKKPGTGNEFYSSHMIQFPYSPDFKTMLYDFKKCGCCEAL